MITELLLRTGYSETKLAAQLGISRSTLNRIRTGTTKMPHHRTVAKILALYYK